MCPAERNDGAVVTRVAALLSAFRPGDGALGVSELARRTGLPKSTVHRLTGNLVDAGLMERVGTAVRLRLRLFEIGQLATGQPDLLDAARPVLADLRSATRNTVHLARVEGTEVVYFEVLPGPDSPDLASRVGGRLPAHATGVGKAILAFSEPSAVEAVIAAGLPRLSARTITSPAIFRRQLDRIRKDGVAYEMQESGTGTVCVACPILDADGVPVAAVSVAGWANRLHPQRVAPAVRAAAFTLSRVAAGSPGVRA